MPLPNMLLAGAPRCGTTALFLKLREHPEVFIPEKKELWFFFNEDLWARGLEWYREQFIEHRGRKIVGEATPLYFCCPECLQRIHSSLPGVKILLSFRNPLDRALSHYWMNVRKSKEDLSLGEAFERDANGKRFWKLEKGALNYFSIGRYDDHLAKIYDLFSRDRTHVVIFEEMIQDPSVLEGIGYFLGLSESFDGSIGEANRSRWLKSRAHSLFYADFPGKRLFQELTPGGVKRRILALRDRMAFGTEMPDLDPRLALRIAEYYKDSILNLEKMLGRRLDVWRRSPLLGAALE